MCHLSGKESMLLELWIVVAVGMHGIMPVGNADAFLATSFGWFCPHPASLLARRNMPLSVSLNAR